MRALRQTSRIGCGNDPTGEEAVPVWRHLGRLSYRRFNRTERQGSAKVTANCGQGAFPRCGYSDEGEGAAAKATADMARALAAQTAVKRSGAQEIQHAPRVCLPCLDVGEVRRIELRQFGTGNAFLQETPVLRRGHRVLAAADDQRRHPDGTQLLAVV